MTGFSTLDELGAAVVVSSRMRCMLTRTLSTPRVILCFVLSSSLNIVEVEPALGRLARIGSVSVSSQTSSAVCRPDAIPVMHQRVRMSDGETVDLIGVHAPTRRRRVRDGYRGRPRHPSLCPGWNRLES